MKLDARVICLASGPPRALRILYPSLNLNLCAFATTTPIPHRSRHGRVWRKLSHHERWRNIQQAPATTGLLDVRHHSTAAKEITNRRHDLFDKRKQAET
jgi:hypothetical protein